MRFESDHAYWLSRIRLRKGGATGSVDMRSRGFGVGDPAASRSTGSGVLTGGNLGPRPFARERTTWGSTPRAAVRDQLDVRATNVASVTVDVTRARVTCRAKVRVLSGAPVAVRLRNCPGVPVFTAGSGRGDRAPGPTPR